MKNKIFMLLASTLIVSFANADDINQKMGQDMDNITKEIKQLKIDEAKLQEKAIEQNKEIARLKENNKAQSFTRTNNVYSKPKNIKRKSKRKHYTSRSSRSGKKVTQHINYKRSKYIVRDYYPTFSKDLKKDHDMQMNRENRLKDTL